MSEQPMPRYLSLSEGGRILDDCVIRAMRGTPPSVWLEIDVKGMLLRLVLTEAELDEVAGILARVKADLAALHAEIAEEQP